MKRFEGNRNPTTRRCVVKVHDDSGEHDLDPRLDLANHSPGGFEWGYAGSGPQQLAVALAAAVLNDDQQAIAVYGRLTHAYTALLTCDHWEITEDDLLALIARI